MTVKLTKEMMDTLSDMISELYYQQEPELGNLKEAADCIDEAKHAIINYVRNEERNDNI